MENLRKKQKIDHHDVSHASSSTESKNLLDLPDEVIEKILDNLNIFDQERFSKCNKKINEIYQSRSKYIWMKIRDEQKAIDLTRLYGKVFWECEKIPYVKEEIWSHLAPSLKVLIIRGEFDKYNYFQKRSRASESLKAAFRHFENIVHWEFLDSERFVKYLREIPVTPVSQVVEMKKLEHLEISSSLLLILNGRFIKFSTEILKTFILNIDNLESQQDSEDLISFISRQKKLEILRLKGKNVSLKFNNRPSNDVAASPVVEMEKLEHMEMNASLFLMLNNRFIKFSSEIVKTLILNLDIMKSERKIEDLISFISRQKKLEILRLSGNIGSFFDTPLNFEGIQLKEIEIDMKKMTKFYDLYDYQQNNLVDFLESQKLVEFRIYKLKLNSDKTQKMVNFHMSRLDLPTISMKLTILQAETRCVESTAIGYSYSDFFRFPQRENLVTENLDVTLQRGKVDHNIILLCLCSKFPNLKELKLNVEANWDTFEPIKFRALETLGSLESFELTCYASSDDHEILFEVTIPNLKKFVYHQNFIMSTTISTDLENFLTRHKNITHLKLESICSTEKHAAVLKFAVETLKKMMFFEFSWWRQNSESLDEIVQAMKMHASPGLVMKLIQRGKADLTLTKGDPNNVTVNTVTNAQMELAEDEQ